jgi:hypothetical protein
LHAAILMGADGTTFHSGMDIQGRASSSVGPLVTQVGTRATVLGAAALIMLATAAALLSRDVRTLRRANIDSPSMTAV